MKKLLCFFFGFSSLVFANFDDLEILSVDIAVSDGWQTIDIAGEYEDPVVVTGAITQNDENVVVAQVRNVTEDSFDIRLVDWAATAAHTADEVVTCIVAESGRHIIGGLIFEAGKKTDFLEETAIGTLGQTGYYTIDFEPITKKEGATQGTYTSVTYTL